MNHGPDITLDPSVLRQAFTLLASAELGHALHWSGPENPSQLRTRVELLAVLLNVVPRRQ